MVFFKAIVNCQFAAFQTKIFFKKTFTILFGGYFFVVVLKAYKEVQISFCFHFGRMNGIELVAVQFLLAYSVGNNQYWTEFLQNDHFNVLAALHLLNFDPPRAITETICATLKNPIYTSELSFYAPQIW